MSTRKLIRLSLCMVASLVIAGICTVVVSAQSQPEGERVSLGSGLVNASVVSPTALITEQSFLVDEASNVKFDTVAPFEGAAVSILMPGGQTVTTANVSAYGGTYSTYTVEAEDQSGMLSGTFGIRGTHYVFELPNPSVGEHRVRIEAPGTITAQHGVVTFVELESQLQAALYVTERQFALGDSTIASAILLDNGTPITGATVSMLITDAAHTQTSVALLDDGLNGDDAIGDGIYSSVVTPSQPGDFTLYVGFSGAKPNGTQFMRQATARIKVLPPSSSLTGTVDDYGLDVNNDELFENVVVEAVTDTTVAGDYGLFVHLKTALGVDIVRAKSQPLTIGQASISVSFEVADLRRIGEDGPYSIERVELVKYEEAGSTTVDQLLNVGLTEPYLLSQFERPPISFTGQNNVTGLDLNGNGKFELLKIDVGVDVTAGGAYQFSGSLYDADGGLIGHYANPYDSASLVSGANTISFLFDGGMISSHGVPGPYSFRNVSVFDNHNSVLASRLLDTPAFTLDQFEGVSAITPTGQNTAVGIDRNGDGKFDVLRTESVFVLPSPGSEYEVQADLADASGAVIDTAIIVDGTPGLGIIVLRPGVRHIAFEFEGWKINNHGANGPYRVKNVRMLRRTTPPLFTVIDPLFDTQVFSAEQFESTAALELTELRLNITAGDGDESFEPGETAEVITKFRNLGMGAARDLSGVMSTSSPDIEVIHGNSGYPNIDAAGEGVNAVPYAIKFKNGSPPDIGFDLSLQLGYNAGQAKTVSIFLQTGSRVQKLLSTGVVSGKQQIFLLSSDGSSKVNLSASGFDDNRAVWSRDGSKIAFTRENKLWVMNPDGSGKAELSTLPTYQIPSWSPTNEKILFSAANDLYTINSDGTGLTQITNTPSLNEGDAKWSPNGLKIAFKQGFELHTINADGSGMTSLATGGYTDYQWSPYGDQIAWKHDRSISLVRPDGTQKHAIVQYNGTDFWGFSQSISWSPDGLNIAYGLTTGPGTATVAKLYSVAVQTGQALEISSFRHIEEVTWSKDGRLIAVTAVPIEGGASDNYRLYVVNVADGRRMGLLESLPVPTDVEWKPMQGVDFLTPITSASLSPAPNAQGWNKENATANMSALDNPNGSGVREINYSASGAQVVAPTVVAGSSAAAEITAEGVTTLTYFAVDNATNSETARSLAIKIDKTAPTSSHSYSIARKTATVTLTATDGVSGAGGISYKIDSGSYTAYGTPFVITIPGDHTVTYYATDVAGNIEAEKSFTLNVPNQAAPEVSFIAPENNAVLDNPASYMLQSRIDYLDGSLASIEFFDGVTKIADGMQYTTDVYQATWNSPTLGVHNLRVVVTDNNGLTGSAEASVTVVSNLPSPWIGKQIGTEEYNGSPSFAVDTFVVPGVPSAVSNTVDRLNFVHQPLAGDGTISARLISLDAPASVKAGLMIRESLDASARYVALLYDQTGKPIFQRRTTVGGGVSTTNGTMMGTPYWLMLVRKGNQFSLYTSNDGSTWNLFNSLSLTIGANAFVGLVNLSDGGTGYFDNVTTAAGNLLPQVSLTGPVDGTSTNQGANVTLTATATDADGTVSRVDFYDNNSLVGTDSSSPYSFVWNSVPSGVHRLTARAIDNAGGSASSGIAVVYVNPSVTKTLNPTADAYARDGSGASTNFGTATTLQVRTSATNGNNNDTYFKFDAAGVSTVGRAKLRVYAALSASGTMNTFVFPVANTTWVETGTSGIRWNNKPPLGAAIGGAVTISSTAYRWYEFDVTNYVQSEKAAGRNTISLALHNTTNTNPFLKVNSREAISGVAELFIEPTAGNTAPTVSLTGPPADSVHSSGGSVTLSATASDADGSVAKIEFYAGTRLVGSSTTAPYQFVWNNLPTGVYTLTAKAIDDSNSVVTSAPVAIEVYNSGGSVSGTQLSPIADTYVTSDTGNGFGSVSPLIASSFQDSQTGIRTYRNSYLKFDSTPVSSVSSAKLRLYAATFNWNVNRLFAHSVADSTWSESDTRWHNRPALGKTLREFHVSGTPNQWYEIDVTAYVQSEKAAGRHILSFGLRENAYDGISIFSREAAYNRPVLIVNP